MAAPPSPGIADDSRPDPQDTQKVEQLANQIEQEWRFKLRRLPENLVASVGSVNFALIVLQLLLIISNHVGRLGYWDRFTQGSISYREAFRRSSLARATHLDSDDLAPWHLWRGWVVPSFLAASAYVLTGLVYLRYELYTWEPELLEHFFERTRDSAIGRLVPASWLRFLFQMYEDKHRRYRSGRLQGSRRHKALESSEYFLRTMRSVGRNIFISVFAVLALWLALLHTKMPESNITQLPRSYVPAVQGAVWYLCNDFFYFYPHWMAHKPPGPDAAYSKVMPRRLANTLHSLFNAWHKPHHQSKANVGIAAWHCSPWEQLAFNLFPALIGPLFTQLLADAFGVEDVWGTHLVTLYVWLIAASANSVMAHTGFRSRWNDPGKHDLHHERAMNPKTACNFGTLGFLDWLHGTASAIPDADAEEWRSQRDRQAALHEAGRRLKIPLTKEQREVVKQPDHGQGIAKLLE